MMYDFADMTAQYAIYMFILLCVANRDVLEDMTDGNVERIEREANQ